MPDSVEAGVRHSHLLSPDGMPLDRSKKQPQNKASR